MLPRRILFVEASTGVAVGGSLTGILHLMARLDRERFAPALALLEPKSIAANGVPVHILPLLPLRASGRGRSRLGRAVLRGRDLTALVRRTRAFAQLFRREDPALVYLANGLRANIDGVLAARLCGLPVVCHEKGFEQTGPVERFASRWLDAYIGMTDEIVAHVTLTGARDDVPACLDAMDVVLHASVLPEPFGRVLIEAMALGRPVIAPREGGPLAIVVEGETGLLVPPRDEVALGDALAEL